MRLLGAALPAIALPDPPSTLEEWAEAEGLGGWSVDELQALYQERFIPGTPEATATPACAKSDFLF